VIFIYGVLHLEQVPETNRRGDPLKVFRARLEKLVDICQRRVEFSPQSVQMKFLNRSEEYVKRTCWLIRRMAISSRRVYSLNAASIL